MNTGEYKTKLAEEKKLLEGELASLGRFDKTTGEWEAVPEAQIAPLADPNDLSDRAENFEERSATTDTLEKRLVDINAALAKIDGDSYGVCESCSKPIEEDRLGANPAARTCKACMESKG